MGYIPLKDRPILCVKCKFFKRRNFWTLADKCTNNKVWIKNYNYKEEWFITAPYLLNKYNDCKGFEYKI